MDISQGPMASHPLASHPPKKDILIINDNKYQYIAKCTSSNILASFAEISLKSRFDFCFYVF